MTTTPPAIRLYKGLSIYRVANSPNWMVRVWDRKRKKYLVKSTGQSSSILAKEAAQDLAVALMRAEVPVDLDYAFKTFAQKLLRRSTVQAENGERNRQYVKTMHWAILNADWGLLDYFSDKDVRQIRTHTWQEYLNWLHRKRPDLSPSTRNTLTATFRNVMKIAQDEGFIGDVPQTPRSKLRDNPRPFFRFHPLVPKTEDAYQKLLRGAEGMAAEQVEVRGVTVTDELYDLILFVVHSFVRPISSELYALTHGDIMVADDPKRLILTIRDGKTGYRTSNTMPAAVSAYERICERCPERTASTHLFLPQYANRTTAAKIIQRQFSALLDRTNLQTDPFTSKSHTLYSLRHTALCMRIINSEGKVNIFNLAKNAGTSVDQIERFYAKYLPLSKEMAKNLQSFGE
jgi:integrase